MKATILKVLPPRVSVHGNIYHRIEFTMADGSWAKTDVCEDFRNYKRWIPIIKAMPGTEIRGVRLIREGFVDADSFPEILWYPREKVLTKERKRKHNKV